MHTCSIVCRLCKASRSNKNEEHALTSKINTHGCTYLSHMLIFQCRTTLKALGFSKHNVAVIQIPELKKTTDGFKELTESYLMNKCKV